MGFLPALLSSDAFHGMERRVACVFLFLLKKSSLKKSNSPNLQAALLMISYVCVIIQSSSVETAGKKNNGPEAVMFSLMSRAEIPVDCFLATFLLKERTSECNQLKKGSDLFCNCFSVCMNDVRAYWKNLLHYSVFSRITGLPVDLWVVCFVFVVLSVGEKKVNLLEKSCLCQRRSTCSIIVYCHWRLT